MNGEWTAAGRRRALHFTAADALSCSRRVASRHPAKGRGALRERQRPMSARTHVTPRAHCRKLLEHRTRSDSVPRTRREDPRTFSRSAVEDPVQRRRRARTPGAGLAQAKAQAGWPLAWPALHSTPHDPGRVWPSHRAHRVEAAAATAAVLIDLTAHFIDANNF